MVDKDQEDRVTKLLRTETSPTAARPERHQLCEGAHQLFMLSFLSLIIALGFFFRCSLLLENRKQTGERERERTTSHRRCVDGLITSAIKLELCRAASTDVWKSISQHEETHRRPCRV